MALRTKDNIAKGVSAEVPPQYKGAVIMRIKSAEFGPSKGTGKPMITWKCEIVHPLEVVSDFTGQTYSLNEKEIPIYIPLSDKTKDGKPNDNFYYFVDDLLPKLGFPAQIDDERPLYHPEKNPDGLKFDGTCFEVLIQSEENKEQKKNPDGSYTVLKDADNNEISRGWRWRMIGVKDIIRAATPREGQPF